MLSLCSFFLIRERTNQESGLKGLMPLRNPQDFLLWHICRSWWQHGERCTQILYVFLLLILEERQCQGSSKRERPGWQCLRPREARCSRPRTSKLAISACRNLFSLVLSLFSDKESTSNTAQRGAKPYFASEITSFARPLNTGVMQA